MKHPLTVAGQPVAVITLAPHAPTPERHAARELASHLHQITGASFAIRTPHPRETRFQLAVGSGAARTLGLPLKSLQNLGPEDFVWRSLNNGLVLSGAPGAPRGTLYAVMTFLDEILGCRWWTPTAAHIPHQPDLVIPALNRTVQPSFEYREVLYRQNWNLLWSVRNRTNGLWENTDPGIPPEWGGHVKYAAFVHTLVGTLIPTEAFETHPEWFAEMDSRRHPDQPCCTHPEVIDSVIRKTRALLKADPQASLISISQNDNHTYCRCARCEPINRREGSPAGPLLILVNAVAEALADEFPKVSFDTLAYLFSRRPPRHIRPHPRVIIRLCSFECDFLHPLDHPNNAPFFKDLVGWSKICKRLYIWDYVTNYAHFLLPHPDWPVLAANIRLFRRHQVRGVFEQANNSSLGGEFAELRGWVLARLLWNPDLDPETLIREFLEGYYGSAAPWIAAYLKLLVQTALAIPHYPGSSAIRDCLRKRGYSQGIQGCYLDLNAQPDAPFLTPTVIFAGLAAFQSAEAISSENQEVFRRVQRSALSLRYVLLLRWEELRRYAARHSLDWPGPENRLDAFRQFARVCSNSGITHLGEAWSRRDLTWLHRVCHHQALPF
jgi:hypothetical protein